MPNAFPDISVIRIPSQLPSRGEAVVGDDFPAILQQLGISDRSEPDNLTTGTYSTSFAADGVEHTYQIVGSWSNHPEELKWTKMPGMTGRRSDDAPDASPDCSRQLFPRDCTPEWAEHWPNAQGFDIATPATDGGVARRPLRPKTSNFQDSKIL